MKSGNRGGRRGRRNSKKRRRREEEKSSRRRGVAFIILIYIMNLGDRRGEIKVEICIYDFNKTFSKRIEGSATAKQLQICKEPDLECMRLCPYVYRKC
jgi:hypothetical protein